MNPKSLENLRRGGIDQNIKKDRVNKREQEILRRMQKIKDDPTTYVRETLFKNFIKEEMNLEDLHEDMITEAGKGNQQKIRNMINMATQTLIMYSDALKAQPKQNKEEIKKSIASLSEMYEEFRKTLPPEQSNDADLFRKKLEEMKRQVKDNIEKGDTQ